MTKTDNSLIVSMLLTFILLLTCKITGVADLSWGWIFAPIWLPILLAIAIVSIVFIRSILEDR